jgi:hypothetical protein
VYIEEDEMFGPCSIQGGNDKCIQTLAQNFKEGTGLETYALTGRQAVKGGVDLNYSG